MECIYTSLGGELSAKDAVTPWPPWVVVGEKKNRLPHSLLLPTRGVPNDHLASVTSPKGARNDLEAHPTYGNYPHGAVR